MSSTTPSAMRGRASSAPSHWERRRPTRSGRSQAKRTREIATSGGKTALGPTARGVCKTVQTLGEKPLGPVADHGPLHTHGPRHRGLRGPCCQQKDHLPPADHAGGQGGGPLPPLQRLSLFGRQDKASGRLAAACHSPLLLNRSTLEPGVPRGLSPHHGVQDREERAHSSRYGHFLGFPSPQPSLIEGFDDRVTPCSGARGHV